MDSSKEYDYNICVSFAGNTEVGKTRLCNQITKTMSFPNQYGPTIGTDTKTTPFKWSDKYDPTIGAEPWCIYENIDQKKVRVYFYDTSGQERFKPVIKPYLCTRADAIFLIYDLTDRKSFEDIPGWRNFIKENNDKKFSFILVGNKCDMKAERQVSYEEGNGLAKDLQMKFFEASAKTTEGITDAFHFLLREVMQQVEEANQSNIIHLENQKDYGDKTSSKCF